MCMNSFDSKYGICLINTIFLFFFFFIILLSMTPIFDAAAVFPIDTIAYNTSISDISNSNSEKIIFNLFFLILYATCC